MSVMSVRLGSTKQTLLASKKTWRRRKKTWRKKNLEHQRAWAGRVARRKKQQWQQWLGWQWLLVVLEVVLGLAGRHGAGKRLGTEKKNRS
jgi:hypothetical protein